jgi:hypothetical protein
MRKLFLLSILLLSHQIFSQNLSGKVKSNKEELIGVTIWLTNNTTNKKVGTTSDIESKYQFTNIAKGNYSVKASFVGYKEYNKNITIDTTTNLDIQLEEDTKLLQEVVVKQVAKKETATALINTLKASYIVADGLSIESIKKTPDRTVGDALKRVSGVTIQNDKFVLVRGLADRYNSALLNKSILPSTEPDRRAFSFDIIPTSLIDNIIINKGASANLPGDFAGGLVQITTKEVSGDFLNISLGGSWGSLSTGQDFRLVDPIQFPTTFPSTNAFRIGSNGDRRAYTKLIGSPQTETSTSIPNLNGSLSFGVVKKQMEHLIQFNC